VLTARLLPHAARLLAAILDGPPPADRQMDRYFREHHALGGRERGQIAEAVYGALRNLALLRHVAGPDGAPAAWVAVSLLAEGISARGVEQLGYRPPGGHATLAARELAARLRALDPAALPPAVRLNLPAWLLDRLVALLDDAEACALAAALNQAAPLDLRVNTLKARREEAQAALAAEGHALDPTPYSPLGLRRADRAALFGTASFRAGLYEVQDEGSQLLGLLVEPRRRETVVDFCAGAGGKTLQLGAQMANTGTIHAFDVSHHRLERMRPRLRRAGLDNVQPALIADERDAKVRRLRGKADRVLVDAPCSGTGTLRRNPDLKWRPLDLDRLVAGQRAILEAAAELVRPGGRLVYGTCSLLREENEAQVDAFLAAHPQFRTVPAAEVLARRQVAIPLDGSYLRLYPHRHGTDAFFGAVLERPR
jgi:16S rRNA (cytosine967-C5)-methyltransferase